MLISPITTVSSGLSTHGGRPGGGSLTPEQRETVDALLGGLDPSGATTDQLIALRGDLQAAGIRPSAELGSMLTEAGIDPEALRTAGAPFGPPPPLPPDAVGRVLDALSALLEEGARPGEALAGDATSLRSLLLARLEGADAAPGSILEVRA